MRLFDRKTWSAVTAAAGLALGVATVQAQSHYYYFDEPQPLDIDVTRVAVFEGEGVTAASTSEALSKHGVAAADVRLSVIPRMSIAGTPATARSELGVQALVQSIADAHDVEFVSPVFLDDRGEPVIIAPHLHVGFQDNVNPQVAEAILDEMGAGIIEERNWSRMEGVYRLRCDSRNGFEVLELANRLARRSGVKFAEPDMIMTARRLFIPNDPWFPNLWGLHNTGQGGGTEDMDMDAPEAWDIGTGDETIIVVVIDDGVQQDHPDINQIAGADFTGNGTGGGPDNVCDNHGTAVAGCVSAIIDNSLGVVGVAPGCKVRSAKFSISNVPCDGGGMFYISWFTNALDWAQTIGARVTNTSSGFGSVSSITAKFASTREAGIVHFAAVDNYPGYPLGYPADLPTVNAVAAINRNGTIVSTSGSGLAFSAPGRDIGTTDRTGSDGYVSGDYVIVSGTSFASPYTAGVAALLLSDDPSLTPDDVELVLQGTCTDLGAAGYDTTYGWGLVNAYEVLLWGQGTISTCELGTLTASDAEAGAKFGHAVDADVDLAVVGAPQHSCLAGSQCGAAYVYRWSGGSWDNEQAQLTASDADAYDKFGSSVSISGDVVLVGAPNDDHGGNSDAGSAYLFRRNDNGTPEDPGDDFWVEEQQLTAPLAEQSAQFGTSVALALGGDVALIGAPNEGAGSAAGPGAVHAFRFNGSSWDYEQTLTALSGTDGDGFGTSMSVDYSVSFQNVVLIGAPFVDCGGGADCGAAYVFRWSGGPWNEEDTPLTASDGEANDWFGWSVSIDGDLAMVGAPLADCGAGNNCGAAYVYRCVGYWAEQNKVVETTGKSSDYFGWSVAFRDAVGLAGASGVDCAEGANCGAAYFIRSSEGAWVVDTRLDPPDPDGGDGYGVGVAIGKHVWLVGAESHDSLELDSSGAAYTYAHPLDCNDNAIADICDILSGFSVDLDEDGRPDECTCIASSPAQPERLDLQFNPISQKIRYLSFNAGDAGMSQAIRVTFQNVPHPYDHWNGTQLWVQQPQAYCENGGQTQPTAEVPCSVAVGGLPSVDFWGATLDCVPHWTDWTQYDLVHVWNEGIIPGGVYDVQVIDSTCSTTLENDYSTALTLTQSVWADVVKDCSTTPCGPPDGSTGIVDVTAILDKYKNLTGNVMKVRADIEGSPAGNPPVPDQSINITDVTFCLGAFLGDLYPPSGFPPPGDPPACQ